MSSEPTKKIVAVTVCYQPGLSVLRAQLEALEGRVLRHLILDNASDTPDAIEALVKEISGTEWFGRTQNDGLGTAHNEGIQRARELGADAVLVLDQDSVPQTDMVSALGTALFDRLEDEENVAAVGAHYRGTDSGHASFFVQFKGLRFKKLFCTDADDHSLIVADMLISSGCLFSMSALDEIGEMDEQLFIDHIDTEWFLRARHRGWKAYGVCAALMEHGLGEQTVRVWFGRWRHLPVHRPFRYYYIYRNSILLYQRDYIDRRWRRADCLRLFFMFFLFGLVPSGRWQNLKMICLGITHGVRGHRGSLVS